MTAPVATRMDVATVPPTATRKEWLGLGAIALACVLYVMDLTVLHLAVPKISEDLRPTSTQLLWIIDIYGFMVAGSLIAMGTLGDRIGRRRLLLIGAGAFGVASIVAAFSTSAEMLIVTRALLGLAGATLAPSTLSLIRNMFLDPRQRQTAIAVWITSFSVGGAIGPLLGGLVLEFFWWGAVFLLAVPVMALLLFFGPRLLPEYKDPNPGRLDLLSAAMSLVAVLAAIFGIKRIAQDGVDPTAIGSIVVGFAIGVAFVRRQARLRDPFVDLKLFRAHGFGASLATYGIGVVIVFGGFLFLPQYLQLVLGLSPLEAGLWTLPWALAFVVGSQITPRLARRFPPAGLMAGGFLVAAIGFVSLLTLDESSTFWTFTVGSTIFSLGLAPVFTLAIDLIVGVAPPERAGAAAGLAETAAEFGGAIGIAIFGSIGVAIYRNGIEDGMPSGVPARAAEAARDTLGAALEVVRDLPDRVGGPLLEAAKTAFLDGIHLSTLISAILAVGLSVVTWRLLRPAGIGTAPVTELDLDPDEAPEPSEAA
jgi:MFS transporter, DHA2 family, multidrug resistance protein